MSNRTAFAGILLATVVLLPTAFAASPLERLLGSSDYFDPSPYSEQDLDEEKQFAPESEGDADLGEQFILKRYADRAPLRFKLETGAFWSDNIASSSFTENDGWFWANRLDVSWRPRLGNNFFLDVFLQEDVYRYDSDGLDFNSTELGVGVVKIFPGLGDLVAFARYEFEYIDADTLFGPDLDNHYHRLHFGAHRNILNTPDHTIYLAADAIIDLDTDLAATERHEYAAHLGWAWHPADRVTLTTFYRAAWIDYQEVPREDVFQTLGVELAYALSETIEFKTSLVYADNDSDSPFGINDYDALQAGIMGGIVMKW